MIKRYCDGCGKELCADKDYHIKPWWTLTRHGGLDITIELCDQCFEKRMKGASIEADTPQTERIKTSDYCDICNHKGCDNCIANSLDDYCVPSGYTPKDTPQTDCPWK